MHSMLHEGLGFCKAGLRGGNAKNEEEEKNTWKNYD